MTSNHITSVKSLLRTVSTICVYCNRQQIPYRRTQYTFDNVIHRPGHDLLQASQTRIQQFRTICAKCFTLTRDAGTLLHKHPAAGKSSCTTPFSVPDSPISSAGSPYRYLTGSVSSAISPYRYPRGSVSFARFPYRLQKGSVSSVRILMPYPTYRHHPKDNLAKHSTPTKQRSDRSTTKRENETHICILLFNIVD